MPDLSRSKRLYYRSHRRFERSQHRLSLESPVTVGAETVLSALITSTLTTSIPLNITSSTLPNRSYRGSYNLQSTGPLETVPPRDIADTPYSIPSNHLRRSERTRRLPLRFIDPPESPLRRRQRISWPSAAPPGTTSFLISSLPTHMCPIEMRPMAISVTDTSIFDGPERLQPHFMGHAGQALSILRCILL
jgi:hypothetical protein